MGGAGSYAGLAALALLAGCAPKPPPPPAPAPIAPPAPAPEPPPPAAQDWRDIPLTPGEWHYAAVAGGMEARFGPAAGEAGFTLRCDLGRRQILMSRAGAAPAGGMTITTSSAARSFAGAAPALPASDPFLDAMAFSRGRFTVEGSGLPALVLPAWPEPARVVEDCRS
jgi:hypothetical protein